MLENVDGVADGDSDEEHAEELNILEQLSRLDLEDDVYDPANAVRSEPVGLAEASRGILNPSHPVFSMERQSTKVSFLMLVQLCKAKKGGSVRMKDDKLFYKLVQIVVFTFYKLD